MKFTRKEKEELANRFNISLPTYYNWEKNKPELIKIVLLGLQKENELKNNLDGFTDIDEAVAKLFPRIKELEEKMKLIEENK